MATDEARVNLDLYWWYVARRWLRDCAMEEVCGFVWTMDVTRVYLFEANREEKVFEEKRKMREEKSKPLLRPLRHRLRDAMSRSLD